MSLFVVVSRNKRTRSEYVADLNPEGYFEYSDAVRDAAIVQKEDGDGYEVFVGKVVPVEEET